MRSQGVRIEGSRLLRDEPRRRLPVARGPVLPTGRAPRVRGGGLPWDGASPRVLRDVAPGRGDGEPARPAPDATTRPTLRDALEAPVVEPALRLAASPDLPAPAGEPAAIADAPVAAATLEDVVTRAWSAVLADEAAVCVVCSSALVPRVGANGRPVAARCGGCGSELS